MTHKTSSTVLATWSNGSPRVFVGRDWYTQKKSERGNPLGFFSRTYKGLRFEGYYYDGPGSTVTRDPPSILVSVPEMWRADNDVSLVTNKAYANFVDSMKNSAQNANNLLEMGQSVNQILSHVASLSKAIHAVKKGDISGAAKALGATVSGSTAQKILKRSKQASDRWLELHFGWEPLVQDIGASVDILNGTGKAPTGSSKVHVTSRSGTTGQDHTSSSDDTHLQRRNFDWHVGVRMGAVVSVSNPNLAIANQMGFVNPLSVAWEAVPFSFVVDWFSNVGQCLSAMTDFVGFNIERSYTTVFVSLTGEYLDVADVPNRWDLSSYNLNVNQGVTVTRSTGITGPVLKRTPFKGMSVSRGATAISLLVQQLANLKR
jgi:hypothetical protein